jgi:hypothetical protein
MIRTIILVYSPGNHQSACAASTLLTTDFRAYKTLLMQVGTKVYCGVWLVNSYFLAIQPEA